METKDFNFKQPPYVAIVVSKELYYAVQKGVKKITVCIAADFPQCRWSKNHRFGGFSLHAQQIFPFEL
jgi:hypothetical protein